MGNALDKSFLSLVPKLTSYHEDTVVSISEFLDSALLATINAGKKPSGLSRIMDEVGNQILKDSFDCYFSLIESSRERNWSKFSMMVERAIELYERRAEDEDRECFLTWEGGGRTNADSVDYRLACIIKLCCIERNVAQKIGTFHQWKW